MKYYFLLAMGVALAMTFSGCADTSTGPTSGGSIAPSGSSGGSIGASQ